MTENSKEKEEISTLHEYIKEEIEHKSHHSSSDVYAKAAHYLVNGQKINVPEKQPDIDALPPFIKEALDKNTVPKATSASVNEDKTKPAPKKAKNIFTAVKERDWDYINNYLAQGGNINIKSLSGNSLLTYALKVSNYDMAEFLLKAGVDVNLTDADGNTGLHLINYNPSLMKFMIAKEINVNAQNKAGQTPLMTHLNQEEVRILLAHGANPNIQDANGQSAVHYCAAFGYDYILAEFTSYEADFNLRDSDGNTPLHLAVKRHDSNTISCLLKLGVDYDIKNNEGITARDMALQLGYTDLVFKLDNKKEADAAAAKQAADKAAFFAELDADPEFRDRFLLTLGKWEIYVAKTR